MTLSSTKYIFIALLLLLPILSFSCSIKLLSPEEIRGAAKELGIEKTEEKKELFKELAREGGKGFGLTSPIESAEAGRGAMEAALEHRETLTIVVQERDRSLWKWVGHKRMSQEEYQEAEQIFRAIGEKRELAKLVLIYLDTGNSFQADRLLRYLEQLNYHFDSQKVYQEIVNEGTHKFKLPLYDFFEKSPKINASQGVKK